MDESPSSDARRLSGDAEAAGSDQDVLDQLTGSMGEPPLSSIAADVASAETGAAPDDATQAPVPSTGDQTTLVSDAPETESIPVGDVSASTHATGNDAPPVTEPIAEPDSEPVAEPATEPVAESVTELVAEPVTEPAANTVAESAAESVAEPVAEPATGPVATSAADAQKEQEPVKAVEQPSPLMDPLQSVDPPGMRDSMMDASFVTAPTSMNASFVTASGTMQASTVSASTTAASAMASSMITARPSMTASSTLTVGGAAAPSAPRHAAPSSSVPPVGAARPGASGAVLDVATLPPPVLVEDDCAPLMESDFRLAQTNGGVPRTLMVDRKTALEFLEHLGNIAPVINSADLRFGARNPYETRTPSTELYALMNGHIGAMFSRVQIEADCLVELHKQWNKVQGHVKVPVGAPATSTGRVRLVFDAHPSNEYAMFFDAFAQWFLMNSLATWPLLLLTIVIGAICRFYGYVILPLWLGLLVGTFGPDARHFIGSYQYQLQRTEPSFSNNNYGGPMTRYLFLWRQLLQPSLGAKLFFRSSIDDRLVPNTVITAATTSSQDSRGSGAATAQLLMRRKVKVALRVTDYDLTKEPVTINPFAHRTNLEEMGQPLLGDEAGGYATFGDDAQESMTRTHIGATKRFFSDLLPQQVYQLKQTLQHRTLAIGSMYLIQWLLATSILSSFLRW